MDAAKFTWPRDGALDAKEFCKFIKPKLTATAIIAHGHDVMLHLSVPGVASDSSRTIELLGRVLERMRERRVDLRGSELILQGDNGPKEVKNNGVIRFLAQLITHGKLRRAELRTLQVGHTHEDIDALFGNLSKVLQQGHCLHTPHDYVNVLSAYLQRDDVRPTEPHSQVAMVDQVRDWLLVIELTVELWLLSGRVV